MMISRKKILSKSRDDINLLANGPSVDDSEDVWYQKEQLFKDHIQEVLNKWTQIDDEIWAKVVILERNRRVAKAYARAPVLTVNGSDAGFDGFRIGLSGFENPLRDKRTSECRRHIGHGVKIKMDENGDILIKRLARSNVFIKKTTLDDESAISVDIRKLPQGALEPNKPFVLFDMLKFQSNVTSELKRAYPNRRKLENQCLCAISFVRNEPELLKCPLWILVINMVAIDMLKSQIPIDIGNEIRAQMPIPLEDPYSVCKNKLPNEPCSSISSSGSSTRMNPPELPPRKPSMCIPQPDYPPPPSTIRRIPSKKHKNKVKKLKKQPDDPYYCGMKARIPNFVAKLTGKKYQRPKLQPTQPASMIQEQIRRLSQVKRPELGTIWGAKSLDSGLDTAGSSQYNPYTMYYRYQAQPSRGYIPIPPGTVYIGEWD